MNDYKTFLCTTLLTVTMLTGGALAGETVAGTRLNAGLTLTDGNSETLRANAGLQYEGAREALGSIRAGIEANYGETTVDGSKETDVENVRANTNARKTVTERSFFYGAGSALYDKISLVDYRYVAGPGAGLFLWKNEQGALSAEAGPSYLWEQVDDTRDDHLVVRLAQRLDYKMSETSRVWQQAEYLPKAENFGTYLLNSEIGIEAAVNSRVNLRFVIQSTYDSRPANDELKKHDLTLISGLSVAL